MKSLADYILDGGTNAQKRAAFFDAVFENEALQAHVQRLYETRPEYTGAGAALQATVDITGLGLAEIVGFMKEITRPELAKIEGTFDGPPNVNKEEAPRPAFDAGDAFFATNPDCNFGCPCTACGAVMRFDQVSGSGVKPDCRECGVPVNLAKFIHREVTK